MDSPFPYRPTDERLDELAAESKSMVFAEITRRRQRRQVHGRRAGIASAAILLTGGIAIGIFLPLNQPDEVASAISVGIPAPTGPADALEVTVTCAGSGEFDVELAGAAASSYSTVCTTAGQTTTIDFALDGATGVSTLEIVDIGGDGGIAVAAEYQYPDFENFTLGDNFSTDGAGAMLPATLPATGTAADGAPVTGHVRVQDVHPPDSIYLEPDARREWFDAFRRNFPYGNAVPLYGPDGTTPIGTYLVTY